MMDFEILCSINKSGYFAVLYSFDGVIQFFDLISGNIKLEYALTNHLKTKCTCVAWPNKKQEISLTRKKKLKADKETDLNTESEFNDLNLIAIGTLDGSIILFSLSKANVHSLLTNEGHTDKVNALCWNSQVYNLIYSCSDDGYIIEWSILNFKIKEKWKIDEKITALAIDSTSKFLISASSSIIMWDLETKAKIKMINCNLNEIFKVIFLTDVTKFDEFGMNYILSSGLNDTIINVWKFAKSDETYSMCNPFIVNDNIINIETILITNGEKNDDFNKKFIIAVITNNGSLYLFNYLDYQKPEINNKKKLKLLKPIKPTSHLKIETQQGKPIKIVGIYFTNSQNDRIDKLDSNNLSELFLNCIYGTINFKIEKLKLLELHEKELVLTRDNQISSNSIIQNQVTKIINPSIPKELGIFIPTNTISKMQNSILKRKPIEQSQMPLEDRLNIMGIGTELNSLEIHFKNTDKSRENTLKEKIPKTDNILVLLLQGLQSEDSKILNHVLQHKNEKVVYNTVKLMPLNNLIQFIKEIYKRLQTSAQFGLSLIKWMKYILILHTSYLISFPDLVDTIGSLYEMMNARTKLFPQLSKLQGKLQLVISQVSSQAESLQKYNDKDSQAILYYQDSTSEDEQIEDDLIPSNLEYEDYLFSEDNISCHENDNKDVNSKKVK